MVPPVEMGPTGVEEDDEAVPIGRELELTPVPVDKGIVKVSVTML